MCQVGNAVCFYHCMPAVSSGSDKRAFNAADSYIIKTASIVAVKIVLPSLLLIKTCVTPSKHQAKHHIDRKTKTKRHIKASALWSDTWNRAQQPYLRAGRCGPPC